MKLLLQFVQRRRFVPDHSNTAQRKLTSLEIEPLEVFMIRTLFKCVMNDVSLAQLAESCPLQCLEWLSQQAARNKVAHTWTLNTMDNWVEAYLIGYNNVRVRNGWSTVFSFMYYCE